MPGHFSVSATGITNGSDLPIINLEGGTAVRHALYDVIIGSDDTPADKAARYVVERTTDAGTGGSALTEAPMDPADPASLVTAKSGTFGTKPADANEMLMISVNQRATFRWVAAPGGGIIAAAAAADGLMLNSEAASSAWATEATLIWLE